MRIIRPILLGAMLASALLATPALAQRGWGGGFGGGWGNDWRGDDWRGEAPAGPRIGEATAESFLADGAGPALGHGPVSVATLPPPRDASAPAAEPNLPAPSITAPPLPDSARESAIYEAAVVDRLAKIGYDTATRAPSGPGANGQITEIRVSHTAIAPAEPPHGPVSGEMSAGVSNRGSGFGLALNIDLSKPKGPLLATRLDARIRDAATGRALWEGHADIITREGDPKWNDDAVASRLAAALFAHFPGR